MAADVEDVRVGGPPDPVQRLHSEHQARQEFAYGLPIPDHVPADARGVHQADDAAPWGATGVQQGVWADGLPEKLPLAAQRLEGRLAAVVGGSGVDAGAAEVELEPPPARGHGLLQE